MAGTARATKGVTLNLPVELYDEAVRCARRDEISLTGWIVLAIEDRIAEDDSYHAQDGEYRARTGA